MISKATKFLSEVKVEVKKVTWPARKEAIGGTTVVVIVVFLVALFLGVVDALLSELVQALIAL
ncbi:MAG: protein translocase subunit SecE [Nitrospinaceae bacterium]|nr:MAG: protein translocase subunit SecE [Nitrospinaceae bacterium]